LAFVFGISTALAVVFFTQKDDALEAKKKVADLYAKVATPEQAAKAELKEGMPYVSNLEGQVRDLAKIITGIETTYSDAMKKSEDFPKNGLTHQVQEAQAKAKELQTQVDQARADVKKAQDDREASIATMKAQLDAFTKEQDALNAKIKEGLAERSKQQEANDAQIKEIKDENQKAVEGLNKQIEQASTKLLAAQEKNRLQDMKIAKMIVDFREMNHPVIEIDRLAKMPKGRIAEVIDQFAYIDKGTKDHVVPGMSFSVFSPGNLTEDSKPKATLTVIAVHPNTSECKIKDAKLINPVLSGDLIQNVAYDPQRVYTFVVLGDFDLHNAGKASHQGQLEVKDMIQRNGGKVADELTVRTDFLVMGDEPGRPPKPAADAPPSDQEVYDAQMKAYDEFQNAKRKAAELFIPILNANRFLALMGYTPDKG
jgi:hypothetical protein